MPFCIEMAYQLRFRGGHKDAALYGEKSYKKQQLGNIPEIGETVRGKR